MGFMTQAAFDRAVATYQEAKAAWLAGLRAAEVGESVDVQALRHGRARGVQWIAQRPVPRLSAYPTMQTFVRRFFTDRADAAMQQMMEREDTPRV